MDLETSGKFVHLPIYGLDYNEALTLNVAARTQYESEEWR